MSTAISRLANPGQTVSPVGFWCKNLLIVLGIIFTGMISVSAEPLSNQIITVPEFLPGPLTGRDLTAPYLEPESITLAPNGGFYILRRDSLLKYDASGQEIESFSYKIDTLQAAVLLDVKTGPKGEIYVLRRGGKIDRLGADGEFLSELNRQGYPVGSFFIDPQNRVVAAIGLRYSPRVKKQISILGESGITEILGEGTPAGRFVAGLCPVGQDSYSVALRHPLGSPAFDDPDLSQNEWIYLIDGEGRLVDKVILDEASEMEQIIVLSGGQYLLRGSAGLVKVSSEGSALLRIKFTHASILDVELEPSGDLLILDDSPDEEFVGIKRLPAKTWIEEHGVLLDPPVEEIFNQWNLTEGVYKHLDKALEHEQQLSLAGTSEEIRHHLEQAVSIYQGLLASGAGTSVKIKLRLAYLHRWLLDQPEEAARLLKETVIMSPQDPILHLVLADTLEAIPGARSDALASYRAIPIVLASLGKGTRRLQDLAWLALLAESRRMVLQAKIDKTTRPGVTYPSNGVSLPPIITARLGDLFARFPSPDSSESPDTDSRSVNEALFELFFESSAERSLGRFGVGEIEWTDSALSAFYEAHRESVFASLAAVLMIRRLQKTEPPEDGTEEDGLPRRRQIDEWLRVLRRDRPGDQFWMLLVPVGATLEKNGFVEDR